MSNPSTNAQSGTSGRGTISCWFSLIEMQPGTRPNPYCMIDWPERNDGDNTDYVALTGDTTLATFGEPLETVSSQSQYQQLCQAYPAESLTLFKLKVADTPFGKTHDFVAMTRDEATTLLQRKFPSQDPATTQKVKDLFLDKEFHFPKC